MSWESYGVLRKMQKEFAGSTNLAPYSSIGNNFQREYLPGEVKAVEEAFKGRFPMFHGPRRRFFGVKFDVEAAVLSVTTGLLKQRMGPDMDVAKFVYEADVFLKQGMDGLGMHAEGAAGGKSSIRADFVVLSITMKKKAREKPAKPAAKKRRTRSMSDTAPATERQRTRSMSVGDEDDLHVAPRAPGVRGPHLRRARGAALQQLPPVGPQHPDVPRPQEAPRGGGQRRGR